jgi:hypothetical protein
VTKSGGGALYRGSLDRGRALGCASSTARGWNNNWESAGQGNCGIGIGRGANCWLDAAIATSAGSAAGTVATASSCRGSCLAALRLVSRSCGSPLHNGWPSSSMTSKRSSGIVPRQQRSTSASASATSVWGSKSRMTSVALISGVSSASYRYVSTTCLPPSGQKDLPKCIPRDV